MTSHSKKTAEEAPRVLTRDWPWSSFMSRMATWRWLVFGEVYNYGKGRTYGTAIFDDVLGGGLTKSGCSVNIRIRIDSIMAAINLCLPAGDEECPVFDLHDGSNKSKYVVSVVTAAVYHGAYSSSIAVLKNSYNEMV